MSNKFSAIDLFCGAGGFSEGFKQAGFEILWANDINEVFRKTFSKNHPKTRKNVRPGDIRKISIDDIKRDLGTRSVDVILGGPPCQGFSNAGKRDPSDPRNSLFREFIEIINGLKPKMFLMENVKGMASMKTRDNEPVMDIIEKECRRIGYAPHWKMIDMSKYGVPQRRHRIFIVGAKGTNGFEFPPERGTPRPLGEVISGIPPDAPNHVVPKLSPQTEYLIKMIPKGGSWKNIPYEKLPPRLKRIRDNIRRYRAPNFYRRFAMTEVAGTVTASATPENSGIIHPKENRKMTPRECARIQTFRDGYVFEGSIPQQYQQIGNAVPPMMAKILALRMRKYLANL